MTFVVRVWVSGFAVVLSALLCPGRQVATRSPPPLLVGFWSFPGPKWLRACCGWGDLGVAHVRVLRLGLARDCAG